MTGEGFWLFLAGVAIFIMGMRFLEDGLRGLAGRPFKLFLRRHSSHPIRAIFSGALVTMVLQSSSIVNLLVLAFVGAGVIGMNNGLALILGANLGTTATSWLIAMLGFEWNIAAVSLPLVGISGLLYFSFRSESLGSKWFQMLLGFGLLFTGLGAIKSGMQSWVNEAALQHFTGYPAAVFLLAGFLLTSLIQSSSATMAITLSVLSTGAIGLTDAMAVALGSEVGTTIKVVIAAAGSSADKKRVAAGNLMFNLTGTIVFLLLLSPTASFIQLTLFITSPTLALVMFQTLVNLGGILLFAPFLKPIGLLLEKSFRKGSRKALFLSEKPVADTDIALETLRQEIFSLMQHVLIFCRSLFGKTTPDEHTGFFQKDFEQLPVIRQYEYIKIQHGEIFDYYIRLQAGKLQSGETLTAERLISGARNAVYAAKSFRDTMADLHEFSDSGKDRKFQIFNDTKSSTAALADAMEDILFHSGPDTLNALLQFHQNVQDQYRANIKTIYAGVVTNGLNEMEVSSAINLNREITTAMKSLTMAAKEVLLTEKEAAALDEQPGFIR